MELLALSVLFGMVACSVDDACQHGNDFCAPENTDEPIDAVSLLALRKARGIQQKEKKRSCPSDINGLANEYENIFSTGNRNAASYKWFNFISSCVSDVGNAAFETLGKGFCPISGSPIAGTNSAKVTLQKVGGGHSTGLFFFCCDPCLCDMLDFVRVDNKTMNSKQYEVLVIGDPCKKKDKLHENFTDPFTGYSTNLLIEAPELQCDGDHLQDAVLSDAGHPIFGLFHPEATATAMIDGTSADSVTACAQRASAGFNSGMGLIFRKVAGITPL